MGDVMIKIYDELLVIRTYLIKKGQSRYTCSVTLNKVEEAKKLHNNAQLLLSKVKDDSDPHLITSYIATYNKICSLFLEISQLCTIKHKVKTMEFDIRTACSLIPLMDEKEETTKRLIDAVEMYAGMLNSAGESLLIKFVLKGRLSENAKLRLSDSYSTVTDLIKDLKKCLLTTKYFTAIQSRLQNTNQGWRSVDEYGTEIEKLFTDLTISQADGDSAKYAVLKPLNEKMAIKIFSNGLKSSRTSMIVAARNYDSLKEAIQAAKDEDVASPSTSSRPDILQYSRGGRGKPRSSSFRGRTFYNYSAFSRPRGFPNGYSRVPTNQQLKPTTFRSDRGRSNFNSKKFGPRYAPRRGQNNRNIFTAQVNDANADHANVDRKDSQDGLQFFRN